MNRLIKDFKDGDRVFQPFLITNVSKGMTASNVAYLNVTLQDKSGTLEGKKWDMTPEDEKVFEVGSFALIEGDVLSYRSNLQMKIVEGKRLNEKEMDVSQFTMAAPVPLATLEAHLKKVLASFTDEAYGAIVKSLIQKHYDRFIVYPAATRNHHEYTHGLLYHTLSMVTHAEPLIAYYQPLNRDLVIAGILLHDLGKTIEFSSPVIAKYTVEGRLIGHISIMVSEIRETAQTLKIAEEKSLLLQHIVLSHHGKPEFGSPIMPLTKEALLVSMVDDLDAKMNMVSKALDQVNPGEFTARVFTLDDRSFYKPKN
jgi:3'-5' exoribonuclease